MSSSNKPTLSIDEILKAYGDGLTIKGAHYISDAEAKQQLNQLFKDIITQPRAGIVPPMIMDSSIIERAKERGIDL